MFKTTKYISIVSFFLFFVGSSFLYAFEWTQIPAQMESYFSQMRGNSFNAGVVYSNPGEVLAAEDGRVIMILENNQSNMGWFESPLGSSVIVAHKNDMLSVYSNLINIKVNQRTYNLEGTDVIGVSGQTAWNESNAGAGFQIIDTKMKTLINPVVLMQEIPSESRIPIAGVRAVDRNNENSSLYNGATLKAGAYTLYMTKPETGMIHSSSVTLNGEVKETISYDTLSQVDSALTVMGNKAYTFSEIYPQEDVMRLADVLLTRGTNTIEIALRNVGNTQSYVRYRISVN